MSESFAADEQDFLLEPLISATTVALGEMAAAEVHVVGVDRASGPARMDTSAVVEFVAKTAGAFLLTLPRSATAQLAERVFAGAAEVIDETLIGDLECEIANVIAGQTKAIVSGGACHFTFRIPRVLAADEYPSSAGLTWSIITFASEWGEFAVSVCSDLRQTR